MASRIFDVADLVALMSDYLGALEQFEATINQLNVFPVPDGDTGTNMRSTIESVVTALMPTRNDSVPMTSEEIARVVATASLLGARGNSGIILAQYLRVLVETLSGAVVIDAELLANALNRASVAARAAVGSPSEGTMLSVADGAARGADSATKRTHELGDLVDTVYRYAKDALWATPGQLEVLERAGVVDAGGAGLVLLFRCLANRFGATSSPVELELPADVRATLLATVMPFASSVSVHSTDHVAHYEVLLLLDTDQESIDALTKVWSQIGDSIAIVGSAPTFRCHVHTTDTGKAVEAAGALGHAYAVEVTHLDRQVEEQDWVVGAIEVQGEKPGRGSAGRESPGSLAIVAVVDGEGMERIYRSLGVTVVLQGGPAMNLSTKEFLSGIDLAQAKEIIVFPNNKNEFAIALEVAKLHEATVEVVEAPDAAAAASTIVHFDPNRGAKANADEMRLALSQVKTGEVTRAIRDTVTDAGEVHCGDHLAISGSKILGVAKDLAGATATLVDRLVEDHHELITVYRGAVLGADDLDRVLENIGKRYPGLVIEQLDGGQHHAELLVALE
ncbi:MAG TPA: DAK2 domain-containing protein [Acidimicrobiales bacterium]|nr:DAK2 domain-containing protein [Acidimicrobiales bacterium]